MTESRGIWKYRNAWDSIYLQKIIECLLNPGGVSIDEQYLLYPQRDVSLVRKSDINQMGGQGLINFFSLLNYSEGEVLSAIRGWLWRPRQEYPEDDFSQEGDTEAESWRRGGSWWRQESCSDAQ